MNTHIDGIVNTKKIRTFETGADRDLSEHKINYRGLYDPTVMKCYGEYMQKKSVRKDGTIRPNDNWKKGFPIESYMESGWRHFMDWYSEHEGYKSEDGMKDALCGLLFNVQGYLYEYLKQEEKNK